MNRKTANKVMTAHEAVKRFVHNGATVGMGGQSIGRCAMALTHEIIRQNIKNLTLVGCNLSMSMDMLVGGIGCEDRMWNRQFGTIWNSFPMEASY